MSDDTNVPSWQEKHVQQREMEFSIQISYAGDQQVIADQIANIVSVMSERLHELNTRYCVGSRAFPPPTVTYQISRHDNQFTETRVTEREYF